MANPVLIRIGLNTVREGLNNSRSTRKSIPELVTSANSVGLCCSESLFIGRTHRPMARCPPPAPPLLRPRHEPPSRDVQICQPAADMHPVGILRQSAIADFGPAEDPLDHQERMFNLRPDLRLRTIPGPRLLTQWPMPMRFRLNVKS